MNWLVGRLYTRRHNAIVYSSMARKTIASSQRNYSVIKYTSLFGTFVVAAYIVRELAAYSIGLSNLALSSKATVGSTNQLLLMLMTSILPIIAAYCVGMVATKSRSVQYVASLNGFTAAIAYIWLYIAQNPLSFASIHQTTMLPNLYDHLLRACIALALVMLAVLLYRRTHRTEPLAFYWPCSLLLVIPTLILTTTDSTAGIAALSIDNPTIDTVSFGVLVLTPIIAGFGVLGWSFEHFKLHLDSVYEQLIYSLLSVLIYALSATVVSLFVEAFLPQYFMHFRTLTMLVLSLGFWFAYFAQIHRSHQSTR